MVARTTALLCALAGLLAIGPAAGAATRSDFRAGKPGACQTRRKAAHGASYHSGGCGTGRAHRGRPSHALFFVAHEGRCPDTSLTPNRSDIEQIRAATLCLVNRERTRHGESLLHWNNRLMRAAQGHTESMAFGDYFAHVGPGGQTPLVRLRDVGYVAGTRLGFEVGENIGFGTLWLGTPRSIVAAWMASAGHRANILDRRFRETGIGVSPHPPTALSHHQAGGLYTQDFGVVIG